MLEITGAGAFAAQVFTAIDKEIPPGSPDVPQAAGCAQAQWSHCWVGKGRLLGLGYLSILADLYLPMIGLGVDGTAERVFSDE